MKEMKTYFVEYKDSCRFGYGEEIKASNEDQAVKMVQMELIKENNYMSELRSVEEIEDKLEAKWTIKETGENITDLMNF